MYVPSLYTSYELLSQNSQFPEPLIPLTWHTEQTVHFFLGILHSYDSDHFCHHQPLCMSPDTSIHPSSLISCHLQQLALSTIYLPPHPSNPPNIPVSSPLGVSPLLPTSTLALSFLLSSLTYCCPADIIPFQCAFFSPLLHLHSLLLYPFPVIYHHLHHLSLLFSQLYIH